MRRSQMRPPKSLRRATQRAAVSRAPCPHPRHAREESTGPQASERGGGSPGGPAVANHIFKDGTTRSTHTTEPSRKMRTKSLQIQGDPHVDGGRVRTHGPERRK